MTAGDPLRGDDKALKARESDPATTDKGLNRLLSGIERAGNRLPDPFMLFVYLFLLLIAVSTVLALMDITVRIPGEQEPLAVRPALPARACSSC
ncbi:MAG: AbgT family transporter [Carbonactinosporaceae bacterium]